MHRRNLYSKPIQFEELARVFPSLLDQLNYVLWIQDIMRAHRYLFREDIRTIRGIDIGTGASAIYPLLACRMEPSWDFIATEIDSKSYSCAERNIQNNQLDDRIRLTRASPDKPILFPLENHTGPPFDFVMCNPPFYSSRAEVARSAEVKEFPPNAASNFSYVCTGADTEMIYPPGGEAAFIGQMVDESERHGTKCRWYTTMVGKMSTMSEIIFMLRKRSIRTYALTEFVQGQTRRWGIAWSFTNEHLPDCFGRLSVHPSNALYSLQPPRNTLTSQFQLSFSSIDAQYLQTALLGICSLARVTATERPLILEDQNLPDAPALTTFRMSPVLIQAHANTWSRKARRNHDLGNQDLAQPGEREGSITPQTNVTLMCSMQWIFDFVETPARVILESQWVFGDDRNMFEGLVAHIAKKLTQALEIYAPRVQENDPASSETMIESPAPY
ncbi:Putative methyltransferase-like protein C27D7.08c [Leucoagaricus sp. SymC.cos]|nr:Putative methyltransferase-like protein C27D7.08c [Leucoagaricus sp. SymC.cos]